MKASYGDILPSGSNLRRFFCATRRCGVEFDGEEDDGKWPSVIESFRDAVRYLAYGCGFPTYPTITPQILDFSDLDKSITVTNNHRSGNRVRWLGFYFTIRAILNVDVYSTIVEAPPGAFEGTNTYNGAVTIRVMLVVDHRDGVGWGLGDTLDPVEDWGMFLNTSSIKQYGQSCIFDRRIVLSSTGENMVNEQHFIDADFISVYTDATNVPVTNRLRVLTFANATVERVNAAIKCNAVGYFINSD